MTLYRSRRLFSALILCALLAACAGSGGGTSNTTPTATTGTTALPTTAATPSSTPILPPTQIDNCPPILSGPNCYTPHQLRVIYGVESLIEHGFTGQGQTIIDIVSFGSPTLQQDMDAFDRQFGLPPITLKIISPLNVPESDPRGDKRGWGGETALDVEIIHAIAPGANIVVLTSPVAETEGTFGLPEFLQLEQYAINNHLGNIISQSWGASEATLQDQAGQQEIHKWDAFFQQATTKQGITFFASSGDSGATDFTDLNGTTLASTPTTSFPTDEPWITSCGGTTVTRTGDVGGTSVQESAWNSNNGASGGGFSKFFSTPSYQQTLPASVQSLLNHRRGVPDVAGDADSATGLAFYNNAEWSQAGGTSASAPLWAAFMAIANQMAGHPLGFINPALYKIAASSNYAQDFHDITVGNNTNTKANVTGYSAVPGWDPVTGLGTPDLEKLLPDLIAAMK